MPTFETGDFADSVAATRYWHDLGDGRVQCDVCPRACRVREGQRGLCFVRANVGGRIVLTTYGRSSGFCVDPIEKKPLNHFLPGTPVLSFGTAGCNLACKFCQNWDISKSREIDTLADAASPEGVAAAAVTLGCRSVAFTYNDPVIFMEYAIDVAQACRERGVKAVAVTAGTGSFSPTGICPRRAAVGGAGRRAPASSSRDPDAGAGGGCRSGCQAPLRRREWIGAGPPGGSATRTPKSRPTTRPRVVRSARRP